MTTLSSDVVTATVQTTDATLTTILTYAIPDASIVEFEYVVIARNAANGDVACFYHAHAVERFGGGTAALVGTETNVSSQSDSGASAWTAASAVSSTNLLIQVTGASSKTVDWQVFFDADNIYTP